MQHSGARKREWSDANDTLTTGYDCCASRGGPNRGGPAANEGDVIEKEMKRLRLAKDEEHTYAWHGSHDVDVDMESSVAAVAVSPRIDYRPINLTLRECHYLRQLRKFQSERVSYLERRAPTDAAAAALMHAMQARRR